MDFFAAIVPVFVVIFVVSAVVFFNIGRNSMKKEAIAHGYGTYQVDPFNPTVKFKWLDEVKK